MDTYRQAHGPVQTPNTEASSELSSRDIRLVALFARFVDQRPRVRQQLHGARSLDQVVEIAHAHGFTAIHAGLLSKATQQVMRCDWIWQEFGSRWSDHVFTLSLANLTLTKLSPYPNHESAPGDHPHTAEAGDVINRELELKTFCEYVSITPEIQDELRQVNSADEAVAVARSHGFLIRKSDFLLNIQTHGSYLRPWMCGDQSRRLRNSEQAALNPLPSIH